MNYHFKIMQKSNKSKLIRIKCMNVLADKRGVVLDRTETDNVEKAAKDYMAGLTSEQISSLRLQRMI